MFFEFGCGEFPLFFYNVEEWEVVSGLVQKHRGNRLIPCFGIHPWFAHTVDPNDEVWKTALSEFLLLHPNSVIGEVCGSFVMYVTC